MVGLVNDPPVDVLALPPIPAPPFPDIPWPQAGTLAISSSDANRRFMLLRLNELKCQRAACVRCHIGSDRCHHGAQRARSRGCEARHVGERYPVRSRVLPARDSRIIARDFDIVCHGRPA